MPIKYYGSMEADGKKSAYEYKGNREIRKIPDSVKSFAKKPGDGIKKKVLKTYFNRKRK